MIYEIFRSHKYLHRSEGKVIIYLLVHVGVLKTHNFRTSFDVLIVIRTMNELKTTYYFVLDLVFVIVHFESELGNIFKT